MNTTSTTEPTASRLDVRSPDGTALAVSVDGDGPALVLVHGAPSDHTTFVRRWCQAAASVRVVAPSLLRMLDTWTAAVRGEM